MPLLILLGVILLVGAFMRWAPGPGQAEGQAPGHHHRGPRFLPLAGLLLVGFVVLGFFGRMGRFGHMGGFGGRMGMGPGGPGFGPGFGPGAGWSGGFAVTPTTTWEWIFLGLRVAVFVGLLVAGYVVLKKNGYLDRSEVRQLRQRLANGEITPEEYDRLLPKLKG